MKFLGNSILFLVIILLTSGCKGRGSSRHTSAEIAAMDTVTVPDTGFTGIKQYYSGTRIVKEVTFNNGIREGEMKSYYAGGQLYQKFWYKNGLREDSALWYFPEGQVYRLTPYKHDTIDGIQKQFYRTGELKAKLKYIKGFRAPFLEEFTREGKLVKDYPDISFTVTDNYNTTGKYIINLELTNKSKQVKFYRGEFTDGVFDTLKCARINTINGKAVAELRKTGTPQEESIGIIARVLTGFGNNNLTYKKIELPYKDLK